MKAHTRRAWLFPETYSADSTELCGVAQRVAIFVAITLFFFLNKQLAKQRSHEVV